MKAQTQHRPGSRPRHRTAPAGPLRLLTAVPICDGHDSAILTINLELVRHGIEVIYLGYHRSVRDIVRAAIQEDVQAIGLSSYNGGHIEFFSEVLAGLRRAGAPDIGLFGGGGGTITPADARLLKRRGVGEIFFAGTPLATMVEFVKRKCGALRRANPVQPRNEAATNDRSLARRLSLAAPGGARPSRKELESHKSDRTSRVVGIAGPGGAGKSTLIDELTLRFLAARPQGRLAILSHDPSGAGHGALLGDRATMVYAQHDRVFMRSLATRGSIGGLARTTRGCLQILRQAGFDLVLVESVGIGQESAPFARGLVDQQILVMSPEYGARLQLQKITMLDVADLVVVNKADQPGAKTAGAEIASRLAMNARGQRVIATVAKHHRDPGVDKLFREVLA